MNSRKLLKKILAGSKNIRFGDMVTLIEAFGFRLSRTSGSHHIFEHPDVPELVTLIIKEKQSRIRFGSFSNC